MFDYLFYRAYRYYKTRDTVPITTSLLYVTFIQMSLVWLLFVTANVATGGWINYRGIGKLEFKLINLFILIGFIVFNFLRYGKESKRQLLDEKYDNDELNEKVKAWMLILLIPLINAISAGLILFARNVLHNPY